MVIAKEPAPGRSKTRLCPPLEPAQAAALAGAALEDTLAAAAATPVARRVLVLEGRAGDWLPDGVEVIAQRGEGLADRLTAAFADVAQPALAIGMDTPQVTPALLGAALTALERPRVDAVLGPARDGGYWAIGLCAADASVFAGVPMSAPNTAAAQRARLAELGLRHVALPLLRDVDGIEDARAVAGLAPATRFAAAVASLPALS